MRYTIVIQLVGRSCVCNVQVADYLISHEFNEIVDCYTALLYTMTVILLNRPIGYDEAARFIFCNCYTTVILLLYSFLYSTLLCI